MKFIFIALLFVTTSVAAYDMSEMDNIPCTRIAAAGGLAIELSAKGVALENSIEAIANYAATYSLTPVVVAGYEYPVSGERNSMGNAIESFTNQLMTECQNHRQ